MNRNRIILLSVGICLVFTIFLLSKFTTISNARNFTMEERFAAISDKDKLSKAETKGTYMIDRAHSYIGFRVMHMGLAEVPGSFNNFKGKINFDSNKIKNSSVEFSAKVKSIDTRIKARDNHLRSKDFFEVAKYPELKFKSKKIKKRGKTLKVYGDLTMKGVTKEIVIKAKMYGPVKDRRGNIKMGFQGKTSINRRDFNVNYGGNLPNGTPMISDMVTIDLQLETLMRKKK